MLRTIYRAVLTLLLACAVESEPEQSQPVDPLWGQDTDEGAIEEPRHGLSRGV